MFAKSKRFGEVLEEGPAPGQYDTNTKASTKNTKFPKDIRWRDRKGDESPFTPTLDGSGSTFQFSKLVPKCQSTCRKPSSNKRRSYFPSSSASDICNVRTSFEDNLNADVQGDEISRSKMMIEKLEFEMKKSKAALQRAQNNNEELKASLDSILNEKLTLELANQEMQKGLHPHDDESESSSREEVLKTYKVLQASVCTVTEGITDRYKSLQAAFEEIQMLYMKRLEKATLLLERTKIANQNRFVEFEHLEKKCCTLQQDFDILKVEYSAKEKVVTDQQQQLTEFKESSELLTEQLHSLTKEKEEGVQLLNNKLSEVNEEKQKSSEKLLHMKDHLENIEHSLTQNLGEVTNKYECLEEKFEKVNTDYQSTLEVSNSIVEKTVIAHKKITDEIQNLQTLYTDLQHDYRELTEECEQKQVLITDKDEKLTEYKESSELLTEQLHSLAKEKEEGEQRLNNKLSEVNEEKQKSSEELLYMKEHLESVEHSLTQNLREITNKYEFLEENFGKVHTDYQSRLERSKSLVEKTVLSHKKSTDEIQNLQTLYTDLQHDYKELTEECEQKQVLITDKDEKLKEYKESSELFTEQLYSLTKEKEEGEQRLNNKVEELSKQLHEDQHVLEDEREALHREFSDKASKYEDECTSLNKKVQELTQGLQEKEETLEEENSWRMKYDDLQRKVGPFMDQLEQYEFEKSSLLNQNSYTQQELKKLSEKYGQMLGHQNNRQKIKHISKLKEEHLQLKEEVQKLRSTSAKDKIKINQLESKLSGNRFDPSKSFMHGSGSGKENSNPDKQNNLLRSVNS